MKNDTVFRMDTVYIPYKQVDSVFYYNQKDTVIIKEGGVIVKYFFNTKDSTVYLKGERQEIIREKKVPVIVNKYEPGLPWWIYWIMLPLFITLIIISFIFGKHGPIPLRPPK